MMSEFERGYRRDYVSAPSRYLNSFTVRRSHFINVPLADAFTVPPFGTLTPPQNQCSETGMVERNGLSLFYFLHLQRLKDSKVFYCRSNRTRYMKWNRNATTGSQLHPRDSCQRIRIKVI